MGTRAPNKKHPGPEGPGPGWPGILEERDDLLALAKPAGLDVFSSPRGRKESLAGWLVGLRPALAEVGEPAAPAIVHRIDRGTSGLVLAARTSRAYRLLRAAFSDGTVGKDYLAVAEGVIRDELMVDLALGARHRRSRKVAVALPGRRLRGVRPAWTRVVPLGSGGGKTLCLVRIGPGMRHQIRAHLAHVGHPVAGDRLYGAGAWREGPGDGYFLHAWRLHLAPALSSGPYRLHCPLPPVWSTCLHALGLEEPDPGFFPASGDPGGHPVHWDP